MIKTNKTIILASKSAARKTMLDNVGLNFSCQPADLNEAEIIAELQNGKANSHNVVQHLAQQKALSISHNNPGALVIGSDQVLEFEGEIFQKSKTIDKARDKLKMLRGQTHHLHASVSVAHNNEILFTCDDSAALTMHDYSDEILEIYLNAAKDDVLCCVGGYALEKHGAWLFNEIKGDYFTILGMPLLPLLNFLKSQ